MFTHKCSILILIVAIGLSGCIDNNNGMLSPDSLGGRLGGGSEGGVSQGGNQGGNQGGMTPSGGTNTSGGDLGAEEGGMAFPCPDGTPIQTYYRDQDGDGLGEEETALEACSAPEGYVLEAGDPHPNCPENRIDSCGVCDGTDGGIWYADQDGDGLGDPRIQIQACELPEGFVENQDDLAPDCETNDLDECGVCGGTGPQTWYADQDGDGLGDDSIQVSVCSTLSGFVLEGGDPEPSCATNDTDLCGVCAGANRDKDCVGVCFGEARLDGCNRCTGGTSPFVAAIEDSDGDGIPNLCDQCVLQGRRWLVQWNEMQPPGGRHGPYTFQVSLFERGDLLYYYKQVEPFDATLTVGYQGPNGVPALTLGTNSRFVLDQNQVFFEVHNEDHLPGEYHLEVDYSRNFEWFDISTVGQPLFVFDDSYTPFELPFDFPFFGENYRNIAISDNGVIALSPPYLPRLNTFFPQEEYGAVLAPFWDDLDPRVGDGAVYVYEQENSCEQDCSGDFGGGAYLNQCGVCVDGRTGLDENEGVDCNGDCFGGAEVDFCGICSGGLSGVEVSTPEDCPYGPDLIVDEDYLAETVLIDYLTINDPCLIEERCISGLGTRKLLRFGTRIANIGNEDLQLGAPSADNELWNWGECHGHFHFDEYAEYNLYNLDSNEPLPISAKAGFAVIDIGVYDPAIATNGCVGYNSRNQGITAGCQDTYSRNLQCQWVDITDLEDGTYRLSVITNPNQIIRELDYSNNAATIQVEISGNQVSVVNR